MREMTELMLSLALTAIEVPLMVNEPAVTCAPLSNFGRRAALALKVAFASTVIGVLVTVVDAVWFFLRSPAEKEIERPISAPRYTCSPGLRPPANWNSRVPVWSVTSNSTVSAAPRPRMPPSSLESAFNFTVSDVAFAAVLTPV